MTDECKTEPEPSFSLVVLGHCISWEPPKDVYRCISFSPEDAHVNVGITTAKLGGSQVVYRRFTPPVDAFTVHMTLTAAAQELLAAEAPQAKGA